MGPTATYGPTATAGPTGTSGPTGTPGPTGTAGPTGTPGPTGTAGPTGTPGPTTTPPPGSQSFTVGFWDNPSGGSGYIGNDGIVQAAVTGNSGDGTISIDIPSGTEVTDPTGQPVDEITINLEEDIPPVPDGYFLIEAFDFGPDGTVFAPSMEITIQYDLSQLPAGQEPVIAYYDEAAGEWKFVTGDVNTEDGTITFHVEHFTTFAVMGSFAAPGEGEGGIAYWIWIIIAIAILALIVIVVLLIRRRSATAEVPAESIYEPDKDDNSF